MTPSTPTCTTLKNWTCLIVMAASLVGSPSVYALDVIGELAARADEPAPPSRLKQFTHRASDLAMSAIGMLGIHYKMGGTNPESGLDCSGLVRYVFKQAWGRDLPRTAVEISQVGADVAPGDLKAGDLVFYNTLRRGFSHVGIYLGDNKFIHSPAAGGQVRIESMDVGYWKNRFNGARRISEPQVQ
jgi:cell wall-associated NlpC family hydrolase